MMARAAAARNSADCRIVDHSLAPVDMGRDRSSAAEHWVLASAPDLDPLPQANRGDFDTLLDPTPQAEEDRQLAAIRHSDLRTAEVRTGMQVHSKDLAQKRR